MFALGTGFPFLHYYNNLNYGESLTPDSTSFAFVFFVPILLSCAAPLFIGSEYSDGTMRNKLIVGHKRYNIYLSEQFVCTAAGFMLCLAYIVPHTALSLILLGKFESAPDKLAAYVGVSCALIIALNAVFTAFSMLCRYKAYSTAVCILLVFALLFVGIGITSALNEPEYYVGYTYTENGITTSEEAEPNPNYLSGTKREIYEFLNDFTSGGQMLKLAGMNSEKPAVLALYDGLITLAATVLGVILFRRKDLK